MLTVIRKIKRRTSFTATKTLTSTVGSKNMLPQKCSKNWIIRQKSFLKTAELRKHAPGTKYGRRVAPTNGDYVYVEGCPHVGRVLDANLKSGVIYHLFAFVFIYLHLFLFACICFYLIAFVFICLPFFFLRSHLLAFVFF